MATITLPPELERPIAERAQQQGTTLEITALNSLRHEFLPDAPPPPAEGSLADFLGDFIGCLDSGELIPGGARMSENIGEKFAEGMEEKRKAERL